MSEDKNLFGQPVIGVERDPDEIFEDERANKILEAMWNKVEDDVLDFERDAELLKSTLRELMALGYTKGEANTYMNEVFSCD